MDNEIAIAKKRPGNVPLNKRVWRRIRTPLANSRFAANAIVFALDAYLRLVYRTNRIVDYDTAYADWLVDNRAPVIATCWHGQHFMTPFFARRGHPSVTMVSRSKDAELNARILQRMGFETVRASGGRTATRMHEKGALRGLIAMRNYLREGKSVFMIADIPHGKPREAGMGVVSIARFAGVPILPIAYASSRRYVFEKAWDKAVLNLPFGRAAFLFGEPIEVPADADDATMENKRRELQEALNRLLDEAYAKVDAPA
ncbi:MAG: lysophospholipid acyltransferase family protein [Oricola sp.]